jgi:hypothetical protein
MQIEILDKDNENLTKRVKELGFDGVYTIASNKVSDAEKKSGFTMSAYSGPDYEQIIRKGKADVITDLEKANFYLDKGLCYKIKESSSFVMFKFSSLISSENIFAMYKNMMHNVHVCEEHGVNALFVSFASDNDGIKSPMQLFSFAYQFGYSEARFKKAVLEFAGRF